GLLLEDRHAVGAAQDRLEQRMRVRDLLPAAASLRVRMDEARLDRAGPDERDLNDDVVEPLGLRVQDRLDLRTALDLERADRITRTDHLVRLRVVDRQPVHLELLARALLDRVEGKMHGGEAAEPEEVELGNARRVQVILVEL